MWKYSALAILLCRIIPSRTMLTSWKALGDIARLHEAVLAYARDFMIDKGFTYVIPPFMMHGDVVKGVMSFPEMDAMMYKIEGEDLYLIGTSEHTRIGRFNDRRLQAGGQHELVRQAVAQLC